MLYKKQAIVHTGNRKGRSATIKEESVVQQYSNKE